MANINGHEIFFGIVGEVEQPAAPDKLPSWFPDVNPVQDLKDHFGDDISEHYVDFAVKINSSTSLYAYFRCYCDTANSVKIDSSNGVQIFLSYTVNGSKIAYKNVNYYSDGTVYNYTEQNWYDFNAILSNNFDSSKICVINKGNFFTVSTYNLNFQML